MTMLPEPTEVMPTRKPATRPMRDIQAKDVIVGGRVAARSLAHEKNHQLWLQQLGDLLGQLHPAVSDGNRLPHVQPSGPQAVQAGLEVE